MSCITFNTPYGEVNVSGAERHYMGLLVSELAWAALGPAKNVMGTGGIPLLSIMDGADGRHPRNFKHTAFAENSLYCHLNHGEAKLKLNGGVIGWFSLALNTILHLGSPPIQLLARLHAQCEIHCWVSAANREWLAGVISQGLDNGIYRKDMGWEGVIALLRDGKDTPVVCSYSVTEAFPNSYVAGWADDQDGDGWYELSGAEQWDRAFSVISSGKGRLELNPDNWNDYHFGNGASAFDAARAAFASQTKDTPDD